MTLLDLTPIGDAFKSVLSTFKDLSRERKLTRKGGMGADIYSFCKSMEELCDRGQVITSKVGMLAKGNQDPELLRSTWANLFIQCQQVLVTLQTLLDPKCPYLELLDEETSEEVAAALKVDLLLVSDVGELRKLILATEPGERSIKAPEDIAERLAGDKKAEQNMSEIQQALASLKSRIGKEFDPGDGRIMATKPRKGR